MQNELTYILGAGASFQSIPLVKTFPKRFKEFSKYFEVQTSSIDFPSDAEKSFKRAAELSKSLSDEFDSHQSFDTFFKKLFHTKDDDGIVLAKKILHLYFIWEHLQPIQEYFQTIQSLVKGKEFSKSAKIDKRYDALVAGLLKPLADKKEMFCKVNFISWNYDLNLLLSLKNYFSPKKTLAEFLLEIDKSGVGWDVNNQVSIINLNGYFYSNLLSTEQRLENIDIRKILIQKLENSYLHSESGEDADAELIKFAWESDNSASWKRAANFITNSKNIVVIGYTFPLYNRLLDLQYFNKNTLRQRLLYIQDPLAENTVQVVRESFGVEHSARSIFPIRDCDSFFIPSQIFDNTLDSYGKYDFDNLIS